MRWVVGDIHGMYRPLGALVDAVTRRDGDRRLLFVGDYVNRGPESRGVVELLLALPNASFVRGNHDDIFDLVLHGISYDPAAAPSAGSAFAWFMQHGLASTFTSYGVDYARLEWVARAPTPERLREVTAAVPASHRAFFRGLPAVIEEREFFVTHALWDPDEPDDAPNLSARLLADKRLRHQALWGRYTEGQILRPKRWTRTGYFGHTPVETFAASLHGGQKNVPLRGPKIVLLDTAVALTPTGRLSAVCVESGEIIQADRSGGILAGI